jgi:hypothetical protein
MTLPPKVAKRAARWTMFPLCSPSVIKVIFGLAIF